LVANVLRFPVQVVFGAGCIQELGNLVKNFGKHALLGDEGVGLSHFAEVEADPSVETAEKGVGFATESGCDFVIGLGGGSPMDAAKVIAARMNNQGEIASWEGVGKILRRSKPLICIPTTSGTGSEATSVAVITGGKRHHKMSLVSQNLYPILAVVDPELTHSMPPQLTASTGMDALTHAIESYVARKAWAPTQVLSNKAVQFIFSYLDRACADGSDAEARRQLSLASFMAGMAFTTAGLGLTHALAYALGSHFGVPHGEATALLLPHVMRFNLEICPELYRELAEAMGVHVSGLPAIRAAEIAAQAVEELASSLPLPENLAAVGISENSLETLAADAFLLTRFRSSNPRDTVLEDLVQILHNAF
jgi:alcohol dehydrogenase class IV